MQDSTSPKSPESSLNDTQDSVKPDIKFVRIPLIRHENPVILKSQQKRFFGETEASLQSRIFFTKLLGGSYFKFQESFNNHLCFVSYWLYIQLDKKLKTTEFKKSLLDQSDIDFLHDYTYKQKAKSLNYLRKQVLNLIEAQTRKDLKEAMRLYSQITIPTICLGSLDLISNESLRSYYVDGSMAVLKELYSSTDDSSPIASFVIQSTSHLLSALFAPSYNFDVLVEVFEVLHEFAPIIENENDEILYMNYHNLMNFFDEFLVNGPIRLEYQENYVFARPPDMLFQLYIRFNKILPSEAFTLNLMKNPVHKVFYSFYYTIGRILDNVFPECRYLTQYRFIGPTTVYPFNREDIYGDDSLPDNLIQFANYSIRLLSFFSRRIDFFNRYMKIMNPYPDKLSENRFQSRRTKKVEEVQITRFKEAILQPWNYPQVETDFDEININNDSPGSTGSFSTNFSSLFSTDLTTTNHEILNFKDHRIHDEYSSIDLNDVADSGLLKQDYDPLVKDWKVNPNRIKEPHVSFERYLEDRTVMMNEFSDKSKI